MCVLIDKPNERCKKAKKKMKKMPYLPHKHVLKRKENNITPAKTNNQIL